MVLIEVPKNTNSNEVIKISSQMSEFDDHEQSWFNIDYINVVEIRDIIGVNYNEQDLSQERT